MVHPDITLATETIHNPDEPRHFMRVMPIPREIEVRRGDTLIARSRRALRLTELGRDVYDPVVYIPPEDLQIEMRRVEDKTTYCPLKGHAVYFQLDDAKTALAWAYAETKDFASVLTGYVAFYPDQVAIAEIGSEAR
ncbi:MAG: DUF427 domain-containing protein [Pseudomonadota bacterium]